MKEITLIIDSENSITLENSGNFLIRFNSLIGRLNKIEPNKLEKYIESSRLDINQINEIRSLLSEVQIPIRNFQSPEIKSISYNSPLEFVIYGGTIINIAIILLGGERKGPFKYKIKTGLIETITDILEKILKGK